MTEGKPDEHPRIEVVDKRRIRSVDDTIEVEEGEPDLERIPSIVEKLRHDSQEQEERLKEYIAAHKEKMAEMDQVRRRLEADVEARASERFGRFVGEFLPLIDDLDRAITHAEKENPGDPMLAGVRLLRENTMKLLVARGLERIETAGLPFDPESAQAVGVVPVDDDERDGMVVEQLAPGYRFGERVLRPAMVRVGQKG